MMKQSQSNTCQSVSRQAEDGSTKRRSSFSSSFLILHIPSPPLNLPVYATLPTSHMPAIIFPSRYIPFHSVIGSNATVMAAAAVAAAATMMMMMMMMMIILTLPLPYQI